MDCMSSGEGRELKVRMYPQSMLEFERCQPVSEGRYNEARFLSGFVQECTEGRTVFDIGAHIGTFTLFAAQAVGPTGKVYAFEMDPLNYRSLGINIARNKLTNVTAINKAVSSCSGVAHYTRPSEESGDGAPSISTGADATHQAEMVSIDQLIGQGVVGIPDVAKIDVEGHEMEVVKGMKGTLLNHCVMLFIEVHDRLLQKNGESEVSFTVLLQSLGYGRRDDLTKEGRTEKHLVFSR